MSSEFKDFDRSDTAAFIRNDWHSRNLGGQRIMRFWMFSLADGGFPSFLALYGADIGIPIPFTSRFRLWKTRKITSIRYRDNATATFTGTVGTIPARTFWGLDPNDPNRQYSNGFWNLTEGATPTEFYDYDPDTGRDLLEQTYNRFQSLHYQQTPRGTWHATDSTLEFEVIALATGNIAGKYSIELADEIDWDAHRSALLSAVTAADISTLRPISIRTTNPFFQFPISDLYFSDPGPPSATSIFYPSHAPPTDLPVQDWRAVTEFFPGLYFGSGAFNVSVMSMRVSALQATIHDMYDAPSGIILRGPANPSDLSGVDAPLGTPPSRITAGSPLKTLMPPTGITGFDCAGKIWSQFPA